VSALDGRLGAGDIVWQQMYSPVHPSWDSTLDERIAGGVTYGTRRMMRLRGIFRDGVDGPCPHAGEDGLHPLSGKPIPAHSEHYYCVALDNDADTSGTDDNWCVLEHAEVDGALW
jgi:hypothetical protein